MSYKAIFFVLLSFTGHLLITCNANDFELECVTEKGSPEVCLIMKSDTIPEDAQLVLKDGNGETFEGFALVEIKTPILTEKLWSNIHKTFPNIDTLSLHLCGLTRIEDHTFRGASKLVNLAFEGNNLAELTDFTFAGAENAVFLDLSFNYIEIVSPKAFYSMSQLEKLILRQNSIKVLDKDTFASLEHLKRVDLGVNQLTFIDPKMFVHNQNLYSLSLGQNKLEEVELELSTRNISLYFNDLQLRKLTLKKSPEVSDITNMEMLTVSTTKITTFADFDIDDRFHIQHLYIYDCKLTSLDNAPDFVRHISEMDMRYNPILTIAPSFFTKFDNLEDLSLEKGDIQMRPNIFESLKNLKTLSFGSPDLRPEWFNGLVKLESFKNYQFNQTSFDYMGMVNALPSLKTLELSYSHFDKAFMEKMVEDLKKVNKYHVVEDMHRWFTRDQV